MNNANNSTVEEHSNPMLTFSHDDLTVTVMVVKREEGPILTELPFLLNAIGVEYGEQGKYDLVNLGVDSWINVRLAGVCVQHAHCPTITMSVMQFAALLAILVYPKIKDWDDPMPFSSTPKLKWFQAIAEEYYSADRDGSEMNEVIRWVPYLDSDKMINVWSSMELNLLTPVTPTIQVETKKEDMGGLILTYRSHCLKATVIKREEAHILTELDFFLDGFGADHEKQEKYNFVNLGAGSQISVQFVGTGNPHIDRPAITMSAMQFTILLSVLAWPVLRDMPPSIAPKIKWFRTIKGFDNYRGRYDSVHESGAERAIRRVADLDFRELIQTWKEMNDDSSSVVTPTIQSEMKKEKDNDMMTTLRVPKMGLHASIDTMNFFYGDGARIIVPEIMKTVCDLKGSISEPAVGQLTTNGKVTIGLINEVETYTLTAKGFSWFLLILLRRRPNMSQSKLNLNKCPYTGSEHSTSWATLWHELFVGLKIRNIDTGWVQVASISDILKELSGLEKTIETYQSHKPFGMAGFEAGEVPVIHAETKKEKDELHEGLSDTPQDTQAASGTATDIPASVEKGLMYTAEQVEHIIKTILQYKGIAG